MKKRVFGFALVVMMALSMVLMGCDTDTKEDPKVVAEQYRGTWIQADNNNVSFTLTKDTFSSSNSIYKVYTEGSVLWADGDKMGTFTSNTVFVSIPDDITFNKQQ